MVLPSGRNFSAIGIQGFQAQNMLVQARLHRPLARSLVVLTNPQPCRRSTVSSAGGESSNKLNTNVGLRELSFHAQQFTARNRGTEHQHNKGKNGWWRETIPLFFIPASFGLTTALCDGKKRGKEEAELQELVKQADAMHAQKKYAELKVCA